MDFNEIPNSPNSIQSINLTCTDLGKQTSGQNCYKSISVPTLICWVKLMWLVKCRQRENRKTLNVISHILTELCLHWRGEAERAPSFFFVVVVFIPASLYKKDCCFLIFLALRHPLSLLADLPGPNKGKASSKCAWVLLFCLRLLYWFTARDIPALEKGKSQCSYVRKLCASLKDSRTSPHIIKITNSMWKICKMK